MTPFCFDDGEREELRYLVEDLREQFTEMQEAADELQAAIKEYNVLVDLALNFLEDKAEDCIDQLVFRTEGFQQTSRGVQIKNWIEQLQEVRRGSHKIDLVVGDHIDSDRTNLADALEDLDKEA